MCGLATLTVAIFWGLLGRPVSVEAPALAPGHGLQCVSYAPFRDEESPFDLEQGLRFDSSRIRDDLGLLARHFDCVRTYSTYRMGVVPAIAEKLGLKVLLGAWINGDPKANQRELDEAVALANRYPDTVTAVIVGNEVLLRRELDGASLAELIRQTKSRVQQPVTYADVWEFWLKNPQVGDVTDFVTIHILPYWEDDPVPVEDAMVHVVRVRGEVEAKLGDVEILIGETGWPSRGRMREGALPSPENQARYIREFLALAEAKGWRYNLIEAFDQPWKRWSEGAVGGYWGLYDTQRRDKHVLSGAVVSHPYWRTLAGVGVLGVLALFALTWRELPHRVGPLLAFGGVAAIGACALTLQLEQYLFETRNALEMLEAAFVMLLITGFCVEMLRELLRRSPTTPASLHSTLTALRRGQWGRAWSGLPTLGLVSVATVIALGLASDPRYRSFPVYGFLFSAVLFAARVAWELRLEVRIGDSEDGREEMLLGFSLVACAVVVAVHETVVNWQAMLWCGVCLLLGAALLLRVCNSQCSRPGGAQHGHNETESG